MNKGFGPIAVGLVAIVAILVFSGVFMVNFMVKTNAVTRSIMEGDIVASVNQMEFAKRGLSQAVDYSYYQAAYDIGRDGGNIYYHYCTPYWRTYGFTSYPSGWMDNLGRDILQRFNYYAGRLKDLVKIPTFTGISFGDQSKQLAGCSGTANPCYALGSSDCNSQLGCHWVSGGSQHIDQCTGTAASCDGFDLGNCASQKGCQIFNTVQKAFGFSMSSPDDITITSDNSEIYEKSYFQRSIDPNLQIIFDHARENFIDSDLIGSSLAEATKGFSCSTPTSDVGSAINAQLSSLSNSLNDKYGSEGINFGISAASITFNPICNFRVAVKALVTIQDMTLTHPVYDETGGTVGMRNFELDFYVLTGDYWLKLPIQCS